MRKGVAGAKPSGSKLNKGGKTPKAKKNDPGIKPQAGAGTVPGNKKVPLGSDSPVQMQGLGSFVKKFARGAAAVFTGGASEAAISEIDKGKEKDKHLAAQAAQVLKAQADAAKKKAEEEKLEGEDRRRQHARDISNKRLRMRRTLFGGARSKFSLRR